MSDDPAAAVTDPHSPDAAPAESESPAAGHDPEKLVPVSEAIRYRKRAQQAEQQLEAMQSRLVSLEQDLATSRETVDQLERRRQIDARLTEADAIDLEAARLLTEVAIQQMDEPDVKLAVDDLRRHKPYLFGHDGHDDPASMPPRHDHDGHDPAELAAHHAAESAARTGDRRDLLRYLRLKRTQSA